MRLFGEKRLVRSVRLLPLNIKLIKPVQKYPHNNISPNKLAPNVPNSILRNPPFCSFASFLIVSLFNNIPKSSRDLPFHHLKLLRLYYDQILRFFLCIPASAAAAAAVNSNGTKTLLANGFNYTFH